MLRELEAMWRVLMPGEATALRVEGMLIGEAREHRRRYDECVRELDKIFTTFRRCGCTCDKFSVTWGFASCRGDCEYPLLIEVT